MLPPPGFGIGWYEVSVLLVPVRRPGVLLRVLPPWSKREGGVSRGQNGALSAPWSCTTGDLNPGDDVNLEFRNPLYFTHDGTRIRN